ncbi:MAG: tRNA pseudouridine(55) synthase TruB [Candidatus Magasanikbacteria bacterium]|nr:tRNA pseudouridine(55) synthase TruB [Candidatus Magasanikbacteria bacterium]
MFLLINKPAGWTSHDIVAYLRKKLGRGKKLKVGHAGTLDPFATGLLIVGVGRAATKRLDEFKKLPKTYVAALRLGAVSDTHDPTGTIKITDQKTIEQFNKPTSALTRITDTLNCFVGKQKQTPPMYSAKKINGRKLYELARQGKEIERPPAPIEIYALKLLDYQWPELKIEVLCSAGTYIRSLAHDLGQRLGVGAYCAELTRTRIGQYSLAKAKPPEAIDSQTIIGYNESEEG